MTDDVRRYIYGTLAVFVIGLAVWFGFLFVNACGFTFTCIRGELAVERTPIPTLQPAFMPAVKNGGPAVKNTAQCRVAAVDLIGAWVQAGSPPEQPFQFEDISGQNCEATFAEVQPLFVDANFWYPGSLSCVSCHSVDLAISPAHLDLSSYEGILAGSERTDADPKGTDILGGGEWKKATLFDFLSGPKEDVPGHSEDVSGLLIFAGKPLPAPEPTPTPDSPESAAATPAP